MTAVAASDPRIAAVVVSYNTRDHLLRCLASLRERAGVAVEMVVVDNASSDGSAEAVRSAFPEALLLCNTDNVGFARACNQGLREARAAYALLLNSDAEIQQGSLAALVAVLDERPDVAIVGPRTLNSDGTIQVSFGPALTPLGEWRQRRLVRGVRARRPESLSAAQEASLRPQEPAWVSAACMLARLDALRAVGFFDEAFFLYEEDVDLCTRVRAEGWRIAYTPAAQVLHHLGRSMEQAGARPRLEYHKSHLRYYRKHNGALLTALLRVHLMAVGAGGLFSALGPDAARRTKRNEAWQILRLAWSGV